MFELVFIVLYVILSFIEFKVVLNACSERDKMSKKYNDLRVKYAALKSKVGK